jgi:Ca-activated chloride channel family protein
VRPGAVGRVVSRALWPWLLVAVVGAAVGLPLWRWLTRARGVEPIVWHAPRAFALLGAAVVVGVLGFYLRRRRAAAMGFSQGALLARVGRGPLGWLFDLPGALRVVAVTALAIGLARPETYRTVVHEVDSIDIMLVFDMSKSMEETDMRRDRLDAAQRVVRRFLRQTTTDRIGLVVFAQGAMLQCPLTQDAKLLEGIVADLQIGDVHEFGTAIGDGLALALAQLRRSDAKSKVVILLSDGDSNWVTRFEPDEAARAARAAGVKVYTVLVGAESTDLFGADSVNPATLRSIAQLTGGEFYRADNYDAFDRGFQRVRSVLDKTKRKETQRLPDRQLAAPFALLAAALLVLELLLSHTRLRRLP